MEEDAKPGHRDTRAAQDIEENIYVDSSSDDDSVTPGALLVHVGGVISTAPGVSASSSDEESSDFE
jgi:hypothetical protein